MGYIDYCSRCKYAYTKDCKYGSQKCNQERARILIEISKDIKQQSEITTDELEQAFRQGYMEGYKHRHSDTRIITIAHHYGYNAQREQFEEECAEAILAAQKCKRTSDDLFKYRKNLLNLAEEVADVIIMAEQMRILISQSLIDEFIQKKLERQIRRINGEETD